MSGVDHLRVGRSAATGQFPEQILPKTPPRPAHEAIIDRRRRAILGRAIAPAATTLENMHDAADHPAIVDPLNTAYVVRQMWFDPPPLFVAQPKQILAHDPDPLPKTNQDRIVTARKLMSFDPSHRRAYLFRASGQTKATTVNLNHRSVLGTLACGFGREDK
jgi:hypothetical protein